ncbi:hypothetical protein BGZ81_002532, partial [Podila clonocystis]
MSTEYEYSDADFSDYNSFSDADINYHNALSDAGINDYHYHEAEYEDSAPKADE